MNFLLILITTFLFTTSFLFGVEVDLKTDIRMELNNETGVDLAIKDPLKRTYNLVRFRLAPSMDLIPRASLHSNIDLLEAISGGALTRTTYPGFSALNSEDPNLGMHGKNVEFFTLNYLYFHYEQQPFSMKLGVIPFHFGYGTYYNDSLGAGSYQSPLEMETGKVSGASLGYEIWKDWKLQTGFHVPPTARGNNINTTGEDKGEDTKLLFLRTDYTQKAIKGSILWTRGVGSSKAPYTPYEVGLFTEGKHLDLTLGQEIWITGGRWGSKNHTEGLGSLTHFSWNLSPYFVPRVDVAYASGEKDKTLNTTEQFRFHGDFQFSHLLFKQVTPKTSGAKDTLGDFKVLNGILTNTIAYKLGFDTHLKEANLDLRLSYIYGEKVANTASNKEFKLGHEVNFDFAYQIDKGIFLNGLLAYLKADKGFDIDEGVDVYKVGASLAVSL